MQIANSLLHEYFAAVERNDAATIEKCITDGVNPNVRNKENCGILHIASWMGDSNFLEQLLQIEGVADTINALGCISNLTPLHISCRNENLQVCMVLMKYGADVNAKNANDQTCLHYAVAMNNMSLVQTFIRNSAKVNVVDVFSHTPLSLALIDTRSYPILSLLFLNGADVNLPRPFSPPLFIEAVINSPCHSYIPFLNMMIRYGANPKQTDGVGRSALHYAAIKDVVHIAEFLVNRGCDSDLKDITGSTPLDIARQHENYAMVAYLEQCWLMKHGPDLKRLNKRKRSQKSLL